jgi:hypothetical protein
MVLPLSQLDQGARKHGFAQPLTAASDVVTSAHEANRRSERSYPWLTSRALSRAAGIVYDTVHPSHDDDPDSDALVTWIQMLKEVHDQQCANGAVDCRTAKCTCISDELSVGTPMTSGAADIEKAALLPTTKEANFRPAVNSPERSHVVLFLRERSWDVMPPDVVRPLASIRLHSLVILATRLGLSWRDPKLVSEKMQADGNGFSLSATTIRGLGLVFQFAASRVRSRPNELIPSVPADKLMCGIVPGCPVLVNQDFPLVGDDCTISLIDNLLLQFSMKKHIREAFQDPGFRQPLIWRHGKHMRTVLNEAIVLLMPFLPLQGSAIVRAQFSGWLGHTGVTMWHFWESRRMFIRQLKERLNCTESSVMTTVLRDLENLESAYPFDVYRRHDTNPSALICADEDLRVQSIWDPHIISRLQRKASLLELLRQLHGNTTTFFDLRSGLPKHDVPLTSFNPLAPNQFFLDLIGAHINNAQPAGQKAKRRGGDPKNHPSYLPKDNKEGLPSENWKEVREQAWAYVEYLPGLIDEMIDERGYKLSRVEIEEAWWMLVLRGIVWDMSVVIHSPPELVPSSFYDNQTRVWLM